MKNLFYTLLTHLFLISSIASADDIKINVTNPDDVVFGMASTPFMEGTETELSKNQIAVLSDWAKTSRSVLDAYVETAKSLRIKADIISTLKEGIQNAVLASRKQKTELLMRYVLNRGLTILEVMEHETNPQHVGVQEAKIRLLEQSIQMALKYYDHDLSYLAKINPNNSATLKIQYATFGINYASFLSKLSNSVFDASAQYQLYRLTLGLLQMDLYRDNDRFKYAEAINKINLRLQSLPKDAPYDDQSSLALIRNAKKTLSSLNLQLQRNEDPTGSVTPAPSDLNMSNNSSETYPNNRSATRYVFGSNGSYLAWTQNSYGSWYCAKFTSNGDYYETASSTECESKVGFSFVWMKNAYGSVYCGKLANARKAQTTYETVSPTVCEKQVGFYYRWLKNAYGTVYCGKVSTTYPETSYETVSSSRCE